LQTPTADNNDKPQHQPAYPTKRNKHPPTNATTPHSPTQSPDKRNITNQTQHPTHATSPTKRNHTLTQQHPTHKYNHQTSKPENKPRNRKQQISQPSSIHTQSGKQAIRNQKTSNTSQNINQLSRRRKPGKCRKAAEARLPPPVSA
jgi:hypothetical protein